MGKIKQLDWHNKKILCIRLDRIGDMMVTTPVIHGIKKAFPTAELHILTATLNAPVMKYNADISKLFVYNKKNFLQIFTLLFQLRKEKYHAILTFTSGSKSSCFFTKYIPALEKIAFAGVHKNYLNVYTQVININEVHVLHTMKKSGEALGVHLDSLDLIFNVPQNIKTHIQALYPKTPAFRLCLFIGNIKKVHNRWAPSKFIELALFLQKKYKESLELYIMVGTNDIPLLKDFENAPFAYKVYIGKDLHETGAFLELCDGLVASSSGPAHIANALGCPVCSLVTKYNEAVWRPFGEYDVCITPSTDITDMRELEVDKVFKILCDFIERITDEKIIPNFQSVSST